jgi:hypothetical protein
LLGDRFDVTTKGERERVLGESSTEAKCETQNPDADRGGTAQEKPEGTFLAAQQQDQAELRAGDSQACRSYAPRQSPGR